MRRQLRVAAAAVGMWALVGCGGTAGGDQTPDGGDGQQADAGPTGSDAGTDAGVTCGQFEHASAGGCAQELTWTTQAPFGTARDHHFTFTYLAGGAHYLGVAGGYRESPAAIFDDVFVSKIDDADGTLGPWVQTSKLPKRVAGGGVVSLEGRVYIEGGQALTGTSMAVSNEVYSAAIQPDGTLGAWRVEAPMKTPRFHGSLVARGDDLYAIGGTPGLPQVIASVEHARLGADGAIAGWEDVTAIPAGGRSHQGAVVFNDRIYLIGGIPSYADVTDEIIAADVHEDGTLGTWETVGVIPVPPVTHSAFVLDGYAYVVGGLGPPPDYAVIGDVRRAPILPNGNLGDWQVVPGALPTPRAHVHQTPVVNGRIYSVGGNVGNHVQTTDVFFGALH